MVNFKKEVNSLLLFNKKREKLPPVGGFFPISHWSFTLVLEYYKLKKELEGSFCKNFKKEKVVRQLPCCAFFLVKYFFEFTYFIFALICLVFCIVLFSEFRGIISLFISIMILIYGIARKWLLDLNDSIDRAISQIIE